MLAELPSFDASQLSLDPLGLPAATDNGQTRDDFAEEAAGRPEQLERRHRLKNRGE